jgi:acylaminoacyl-peptidase
MDIMKDRARSTLWMIGADGREHRPLTSGSRNDSRPRWSPDGGRLLYVASEGDAAGENGPAQVFCRWMDTGQTARLAQLTASPSHPVWSPDGKRIAFFMRVPEQTKPFVELPPKPEGAEWAPEAKVIRKVTYRFDGQGYLKDGFRQLFVLPADGGTPRQLTSGPYEHEGPAAWSRDGRSLVFSGNRREDWEYHPVDSELYEVSLDSGEVRQLTDRRGPDFHPVISPDGTRLAWLGFDDRRQGYQITRLYVGRRDGGEPRAVAAEFDRDVSDPVWADDGRGLYFLYDEHGRTKVGFVSLDGSVATLADDVGGTNLGRPYASGSFSYAGSAIAFTQTAAGTPADVAIVPAARESGAAGRDGGSAGRSEDPPRKAERLSRLNEDLLGHKRLAEVEELWFESSHDQRKVQAWIVKPPGFDSAKKYPLILEIHGGPFANYGLRFAVEMQLYAAAGYVVLYVNPRGSTGYGEEFGNLIHHAYPGHDYDDLMSGVDALIERGYVDTNNLFVTGGSGGGVLTAWIVGKTDRFRAAVASKPVINWYSFTLTADAYPFFAQYWFPGTPWEQAEHYLKRSPLSLVGNVSTPTMLLTGEADYRTPISESEQFYQALKLRKVATALVRIPEASHEIVDRPSRLIAKVAHVLKWFELHRKTEGAAARPDSE